MLGLVAFLVGQVLTSPLAFLGHVELLATPYRKVTP